MSKSAKANDAARNGPPFEELEKARGHCRGHASPDDLPLEMLLSKYEEGTKLEKSARKNSPKRSENPAIGKERRRAK